ncbi:MAG: class I SAM-dependent methyltransferase [Acidobacteria bacterium]|nr:class I SAM-dependent methyltransferase [Acidobacteriota bacterium]
MFTALQYRILRQVAPGEPQGMDGSAYANKSKLEVLLGPMLPDLRGKVVVDFGCGEGGESAELVEKGAKVYGVDIREDVLAIARSRCPEAWFGFAEQLPEKADYIISLDSFEHFGDPAAILAIMARLLKPGGHVLTSFGPTWYHPLGGHLFSVFPWSHILFSEAALIRWRSDIRSDGATRFSECAGGLNQMTIRRFERLVEASPLRIDSMECKPIRRTDRFHNRMTRELLTAIVRCKMTPR